MRCVILQSDSRLRNVGNPRRRKKRWSAAAAKSVGVTSRDNNNNNNGFTETSPLNVHFLRCVDDAQLDAMHARLQSNVRLTCVSEEMHQRGLKDKASLHELLPASYGNDTGAEKERIHILVEGNLSAKIVAELLDAVSPSAFLIPYAGLPASLQPVLHARDVPVFSSHHNAPIASELCLSLLLSAAKQTVRADADLRRGSWQGRGVPLPGAPSPLPHLPLVTLQAKKCCVLGIRGRIGTRIARSCAAMEMSVVGTSSRVRTGTTEVMQLTSDDEACVYASDDTIEAVRGVDVLIVALPNTPETRGIVGAAELEAMMTSCASNGKDGCNDDDAHHQRRRQCILINIGRGDCCDGDAIHRALENGDLYAFASDVWWQYPTTWEEAANCPPVTPSGLSFATGIAGSKTTLSSHRGGAPGQPETDARRLDAMVDAFNFCAAVGDACALASGPHSLIGRVDLERGY